MSGAPGSWSPISIAQTAAPAVPVSEEIVIGKDILELLTGAMYSEPLMIYREYVQNAADAIDELLAGPHEPNAERPTVEISIDAASRNVLIRDTGTGIPRDQFERRLTALGASLKRGQAKRGFRGVGRLSGLGYCRELAFRSRRSRGDPVMELVWNGRRLRELLRDVACDDDLKTLIKSITSVRTLPGANYPARFFEVELRGIARVKNDALLNPEAVASYLSEVAPIAFDPDFSLGEQIDEFLVRHGVRVPAPLTLRAGKVNEIVRPHRDEVAMSKMVSRIGDMELLSFDGIDDEVAAIGWILHHDYLGSIPREARVDGIRVRCGNIQIGSPRLLDELFPESRFNSWCIGEIHVLSQKIVPNGRRDNFEANAAWQDLQGKLATLATQLTRRCRTRSIARNKLNDVRREFQATKALMELVAFQSRYGLSREDATSLVTPAIDKFAKIASSPNLPDDAKREAAALAAELERSKRNAKRQARGDPLGFLSAQRRAAYREVFTLMLRATKRPHECIQLIDSVVASARRRARAR